MCKKTKQVESKQQYAVARNLKSDKQYQFEKVFDGDSTQDELWTVFEPFVDGALIGFTSTILTYGPAGGGKSYTLVGSHEQPGVIPRALIKIFQTLEEVMAADPLHLTEVEMSYVEYSNNVFSNLLKAREKDAREIVYTGSSTFTAPHPDADLSDFDIINVLTHTAESMIILHSDKIDVRENKDVGVFLSGPKIRIPVSSAKQALHFIKWADSNREKLSADDARSRGHMILTVYVDTKIGNEIKLGRIHFVDLVGGERMSDTGSDSIQDISFINKSLHAFGDVLFSLSNSTTTLLRRKSSMKMSMADIHSYQLHHTPAPLTPTPKGNSSVPPSPASTEKTLQRKGSVHFSVNSGETVAVPTGPVVARADIGMGHVPYLNSKLTHLLKDSLGGTGLTTMILNIPIENESYHQTVVVYEYAARGRKVMNRPVPCRYEMCNTRYDANSELSVLKQLKQRLYTPAPPGYDKKKAFVYDRPLMSPTRRAVILSISKVRVEDAPYLCFPMYPWATFEVGSRNSRTSMALYVKDHAKYDDEMTVEVQPDDFESGIDLEAHVTTKAVTGEDIALGRAVTQLRPLFPAYEEKFTHTLPLYFERFGDTYQQGRITFEGSVSVQTIKNTSLLTGPASPSGKRSTFLAAPGKFYDPGFDWSQPCAHLVINKISSPDSLLGPADNPDLASIFHFSFESKVGNQLCLTPFILGKSRYRGKDVVAAIQTDEPATQFDVTRNTLMNDGLQVMVFMKGNDSVPRALGRAQFKLDNALIVKLESGVSKDVSAQLKNVAGTNAGKLILNMQLFPFGKVHRRDSRSSTPIDKLMFHEHHPQDLLDGILPPNFTAGWIRFKSADAIRLNTLKLLGNHARYAEYLDDPKGLEAIKQDLMLIVEFGDHWASRTAVKSDEEDTAQWLNLDFKLYVERDDLRRIPFKFSVYNLKAPEDYSLISSSLVHFTDLQVNANFTFDKRPVLLKSPWNKKPNGKLFVSGVVVKDSVTSWLTAIVVKVHKGGKYDVCYEDGEIETMVSKDLLSLVVNESKPGTARSAMKLKPRFAVGTAVEIQFGGNDLWFPAVIAADHSNGYYDVTSDFEIPRNNIHESQIRLSELGLNRKKSMRHLTGRYTAGDKVEANYQAKGTWYPAKIWKVRLAPDGVNFLYDLDYKSGERELGVTDNRMRAVALSPSKSMSRMKSSTNSSFHRVMSSDDQSEATGTSHSGTRGRSLERGRSSRANLGSSRELSRTLSRSRSRSRSRSHSFASAGGLGDTDGNTHDDDDDDDLDSDEEVFAVDESNLELPFEEFQIGERVEARFRGSEEFFSGVVIDITATGEIGILYDGGEKVNGVAKEDIRLAPLIEASDGHVDAFKVGDKIEANYRGLDRWLRGKIHKRRGGGIYDIVYADGKVETKVVESLIRKVAIEIDQGFKYSVGDEVEVNIDELGYWYRGEVIRRRNGNSYDIEFDDGGKEYGIIGRLIRRAKPIDYSIPIDRPFFVVGDRVLVKSRSKAVDSAAKALKEAQRAIRDALGALFKSLREIEAEEARMKVAKKHAADESKNLQGLKKEILYAEAKSKFVLGPKVVALKGEVTTHDNASKLASKLRNDEEKTMSTKLSNLKKLLAQLSKSEHLMEEHNAEAEKSRRSGLEEEELLTLENALKNTKLELIEVETCKSASDDTLHTVKNARMSILDEDRALKATSDLAKRLLSAYGVEGAGSGFGADAFGDLKIVSADDDDEVDFNVIYKGSKSSDAGDQLVTGSLDDLDELFEPLYNNCARTNMGAMLCPNKEEKLEEDMQLDRSKMPDRLALIMGPRARSDVGVIARMKAPPSPKRDQFKTLMQDNGDGVKSLAQQQHDFHVTKSPEYGEKELTISFSRRRPGVIVTTGNNHGKPIMVSPKLARGKSLKLDRRPSLIAQKTELKPGYDVRKSLEEKRGKSNNAEEEYYKAAHPIPRKLDEVQQQERIMKDFIKAKALKPLLQSPLGKDFRNYVNKIKPLHDAAKQAEEKRQAGEERALVAKKSLTKALKRAVRATGTKIRPEDLTGSDAEEEKAEREAEREAEQAARIVAERDKRLYAENVTSAPLSAEERAVIIKGNDHLATRMVQLRPVPQEVLEKRAKATKEPAKEIEIVREAKRRQFARKASQGNLGLAEEEEEAGVVRITIDSADGSSQCSSVHGSPRADGSPGRKSIRFDEAESKNELSKYIDDEPIESSKPTQPSYVLPARAKDLYEKAKKAAVEEWSCWEDAKLLADAERKLLDDLIAAQRRLGNELHDVSQFSSVITDYVALRKDWLDVMTKFADSEKQYEQAVHVLSELKRDLAKEKKTLELMAAKAPNVEFPPSVLRKSLNRQATFSDKAPSTLKHTDSSQRLLSRSPSFNRSMRAPSGILKRSRSHHGLKSAISGFLVSEDVASSANNTSVNSMDSDRNSKSTASSVSAEEVKPATETQFSAMLRSPSSSNLLRRSRSNLFGNSGNNNSGGSRLNVLGRSMSGIFLPTSDEVGLPAELTTREEEKARACLAEFEGLVTEATTEESRWSPNETAAFRIDKPEMVKIYEVDRLMNLEKLFDSTAMNAGFRYLKKANEARKAALQLRLFQLEQMQKAQQLTEAEASNIQRAISRAVAGDEGLKTVQQDVELQAAFEVAMKELSDALFTLADLADQVVRAEDSLKFEESQIDGQMNALILDPGNADISEHDADAVKELQNDLKKQIHEALAESHRLGDERSKVETTLEVEAVERIGLSFHAVSASASDPNSVEYNFDKIQEVKEVHGRELEKLKEAIVFAEKQLQALQIADQAAKEASSTICNAFARKLFSELEAAEEAWRAAHGALMNSKNESAFFKQDLEKDKEKVDDAKKFVDTTLAEYQHTLSQFRQGQLFLASQHCQKLIGQVEMCKKKANELGDLRGQDETKRDDLAGKRDGVYTPCYEVKLELTDALKIVHRDYQKFLEFPTDLSQLVRELKHMKESLHENTDQANKVTEFTDLEKKHLEYEKTLLTNELEYLNIAKKALNEIADAGQDVSAKARYNSLMGEILLTGADDLFKLNAEPLSAADRSKNKHFVHSLHGQRRGSVLGNANALLLHHLAPERIGVDAAVSNSIFGDPFGPGDSSMKDFELDGRSGDQIMLKQFKKLYPAQEESEPSVFLPSRATEGVITQHQGKNGSTIGSNRGKWNTDGTLAESDDLGDGLDTHFKEFVEDLMHVPVESLMEAIEVLEARTMASHAAENEVNNVLPVLFGELKELEEAMNKIHEYEEVADREKLHDYVVNDDDLDFILRRIEKTAALVLVTKTETETIIRRTYVEEVSDDDEVEGGAGLAARQ
jgi:hypothetical protein